MQEQQLTPSVQMRRSIDGALRETIRAAGGRLYTEEITMKMNGSRRRGMWCMVVLIIASSLMACSTSTANTSLSNQIAITAQAPHSLYFYEGSDDNEPFTPFLASLGPSGIVATLGFATNEGAYYVTTYNTTTWRERANSNGLQPSDPLGDCDQAPDRSTVFAPNLLHLARSCADGSLAIFNLPDAIAVYRQPAASETVTLSDRVPVVAFAPDNQTVALTDDGPAGPGQTITVRAMQTWQVQRTLTVAAGLLSRPAWSPDGTRLALVALDGTLQIWDATTGAEVAHATLPGFALGSAASDPAGPAPIWSADGTTLFVTAPTSTGTSISTWSLHGNALVPGVTTTLTTPPNAAAPQLSPDGAYLFLHTAATEGQIRTTTDLHSVATFALPGALAIWTGPRDIAAFTTHDTVIDLHLGS
jgi:WD40 repeat protein